MTKQIYNFRLNTSNAEESEQAYELKHQMIRDYWANLTSLFLKKGKSIKFMYWAEDIEDENSGYPNSGYGIKKVARSDDRVFYEKNTDDMVILHAPLNAAIKNLILHSIKENHMTVSPFFYFDIICENGLSIYSSQDFGENVLMFLTHEDLTLVDPSILISLPEDITHNF